MKFTNIYKETEENLQLALLSLWTPGSHQMRPAIQQLFKDEPLLAEPVFQSTFGWESTNDDTWKPSLNTLVWNSLEKMREQKAKKEGKAFRPFVPFKHQAESWKTLHEGKSIVVTSGTGSGKTECFMYPVLSDLYEHCGENAVQALFLYPLNALMEDQKNRLAEYCEPLNLKFAVYNGDTPEFHADGRDGEDYKAEVKTREEIRDPKNKGSRPQILLTNPSMLEYILVRQKDQVLLEKSAGKLRWIVIDEAHSYSGSAAVELANQIKRILDAFQVKAEDVRFACTSATIGGEDGTSSLIKFIKDIIGQPVEQIRVIGGNRLVPEISNSQLHSVIADNGLHVKAEGVCSLRDKINKVAGMTLQQMWQWLCPGEGYNNIRALQLLDKLCELQVDGKSVLSLRAHFFMRALSGLYACANENCKGTSGTAYGHLTTYKASVCPDCGNPLLELVQCKRCGRFVLMGSSDSQTHKIYPCAEGEKHDDYFAIDDEIELDVQDVNAYQEEGDDTFYMIPFDKDNYHNPSSSAHSSTLNIIHKASESILENAPFQSGKWVDLRKDANQKYCPCCGRLAKGKRLNLKYFRIPINFINQTISPVFLHECAPKDKSWGKYIAFTDSRQGTAISAKTFNIDVERRVGREKIVKDLATRKAAQGTAVIDINILKAQGIPQETINQILALQSQATNVKNNISLHDASNLLFDEKLYEHIAGKNNDSDVDAYKAALLRQFIGSHAIYEQTAENMGLITLEYPALKDVRMSDSLETLAREKCIEITEKDWSDYLKICLDYFIRSGNHIQPLITGEVKFVRDTNKSTPITKWDEHRSGTASWPQVKVEGNNKPSPKQPRLITLLCGAFGLDSVDKLDIVKRQINQVLADAWNILEEKKLLTRVTANDTDGYNHPKYYKDGQYVDCYYLDLSSKDTNTRCVIKHPSKAWECPVSNTLLDTIFCGFSPLITGELSAEMFKKFKVNPNQVDLPNRPDDLTKLSKWYESDLTLHEFEKKGFWTDRHKYIYLDAPAYIAAEHSAQQSKELLREYTKSFAQKNPVINVLHCSTTMEMGVDIGDIDIVIMDTIPPTAANYLQRIGRAGRMGQSKAVAFSLCNNTPVGQNAFANPMWALQTMNHMIPVRSSQTIIQRHINSFFFREFICGQGVGIQGTATVGEFMESPCDDFIEFLDDMSTNKEEEKRFHKVFGENESYTIVKTKELINEVQEGFKDTIKELEDALTQYQKDDKRKIAISNQINKCKQGGLLNYLSEHQFLPNASMPTGVVTFDFTDRDQSNRLFKLYKEANKLKEESTDANTEDEKILVRQKQNENRKKIQRIKRDSQASRDIHTALNEYAPEQTVVVNEKNYVSAGVLLFGAYNEKTQTKAIYHCQHCGKTEYLPILDENRICPNCNNPYHSIIDKQNGSYTLAYEPIGFRTDQNMDSTRQERTEKRFYDIRPVLLNSDWSSPMKDVNMCEVNTSGETGEILFYNVGNGYGFAFCKHCGRAVVEPMGHNKELPNGIKLGHNRLWGDVCDANTGDIARHVVFTGRHQTCYSVIRVKSIYDSKTFEKDEELAFSLGVVLKRALVKFLGIDETEIDFGIKDEQNNIALFIFDTARGGCGYSLHFNNPQEFAQILDIARELVQSYTCNCHVDGGACARCLVDRTNYPYAHLLSKSKVIEWLDIQKEKSMPIPSDIQQNSVLAKVSHQALKAVVKEAVKAADVKEITFCVSDIIGNNSINDWSSIRSEMGKNIRRAVELGKTVTLIVEYHPDLHLDNADKFPYIDLKGKFPDCNVKLVKDQGKYKTVLILKDRNDTLTRYFTQDEDMLSLSNDWGCSDGCVYFDDVLPEFVNEELPNLEYNPDEIIREGSAKVDNFKISKYFSEVIAPCTMRQSDIIALETLFKGKHVSVTFSDMYVNSALASLMLAYLIKEVRDIFSLKIDDIMLQLDSSKRKVVNDRFSDYTYINMNFGSKESADRYTDNIIDEVLDIKPDHSLFDAEHHRWLKFTSRDGYVFEIRPDHSISGGWISSNTYMNLDTLDGSTIAKRRDDDVLYYAIIRKHK